MSALGWIGVGVVTWIAVSIPTALVAGRWLAEVSDDYPALDGDDDNVSPIGEDRVPA